MVFFRFLFLTIIITILLLLVTLDTTADSGLRMTISRSNSYYSEGGDRTNDRILPLYRKVRRSYPKTFTQ